MEEVLRHLSDSAQALANSSDAVLLDTSFVYPDNHLVFPGHWARDDFWSLRPFSKMAFQDISQFRHTIDRLLDFHKDYTSFLDSFVRDNPNVLFVPQVLDEVYYKRRKLKRFKRYVKKHNKKSLDMKSVSVSINNFGTLLRLFDDILFESCVEMGLESRVVDLDGFPLHESYLRVFTDFDDHKDGFDPRYAKFALKSHRYTADPYIIATSLALSDKLGAVVSVISRDRQLRKSISRHNNGFLNSVSVSSSGNLYERTRDGFLEY